MLIPISIVIALILVSQGTPENYTANLTVQTLEGKNQDIAMGPMAALVAIKHLGTNGGGFLGANSSTPLENPTHSFQYGRNVCNGNSARSLRDRLWTYVP